MRDPAYSSLFEDQIKMNDYPAYSGVKTKISKSAQSTEQADKVTMQDPAYLKTKLK